MPATTKAKTITTYKTQNDLPAQNRAVVVAVLNPRFADTIDLMQAQQAHCNVKGRNFIALHKLFDEIANPVVTAIAMLERPKYVRERFTVGH